METPHDNISIDYTHADTLAESLIHSVQSYMKADPEVIRKTLWDTYIFAREAHHGQLRKSGEPYIIHPLMAADILLYLKPDLVTLQSCILHDVIEDTPQTKEDIQARFGEDVGIICE